MVRGRPSGTETTIRTTATLTNLAIYSTIPFCPSYSLSAIVVYMRALITNTKKMRIAL
jgi:hypothetical protein